MDLPGTQRQLSLPASDWPMSLLVEMTSVKQSTCVCWVLQARLTNNLLLSPFSRICRLTVASELLSLLPWLRWRSPGFRGSSQGYHGAGKRELQKRGAGSEPGTVSLR